VASVYAVIPARNEADLLLATLRSLLMQDYPGPLTVVLVDDQSTDGTARVAQGVAQAFKSWQLNILSAEPCRLAGRASSGLWSKAFGRQTLTRPPDYFLLTDAD